MVKWFSLIIISLQISFVHSFGYCDRLKDLTSIAGIRSNQLVGYGIEVGLNGNDFTINGVTKPILQLGKLTRYVFDLSDPSLNGVGFGISTTEQGISGEDVSGQTLISLSI